MRFCLFCEFLFLFRKFCRFPQISAKLMYCFQAEIRISANLRKTCAKTAEKQLQKNAREISQSPGPRIRYPYSLEMSSGLWNWLLSGVFCKMRNIIESLRKSRIFEFCQKRSTTIKHYQKFIGKLRLGLPSLNCPVILR